LASPKVKVDIELEKRRMLQIIDVLKREYPEAKCSLDYKTPFQLLVATILSAQCTDVRVNIVTPALFARYPDAESMSKANIRGIEKIIASTGFFKMKAKALKEASSEIVRKHQGKVPNTMEQLIGLRGVGRKTANVVLGNAYDVPSMVVDTHMLRVNKILGFTKNTDATKVEHDLMELVPKEDWTLYAHLIISHGRAICVARRPKCEVCPIERLCPKIGVSKVPDYGTEKRL
jgi:endonuclease III